MSPTTPFDESTENPYFTSTHFDNGAYINSSETDNYSPTTEAFPGSSFSTESFTNQEGKNVLGENINRLLHLSTSNQPPIVCAFFFKM